MTYELAQQLKDAGFPQEMKEGDLFFHEGKLYIRTGGGHLDQNNKREGLYVEAKSACCDTEDFPLKTGNIYDNDGVKLPTLSELIEACPKEYQGMSFDLAWLPKTEK